LDAGRIHSRNLNSILPIVVYADEDSKGREKADLIKDALQGLCIPFLENTKLLELTLNVLREKTNLKKNLSFNEVCTVIEFNKRPMNKNQEYQYIHNFFIEKLSIQDLLKLVPKEWELSEAKIRQIVEYLHRNGDIQQIGAEKYITAYPITVEDLEG
jgi:hypothetical protein